MILFNNEVLIVDEEHLNEFVNLAKQEVFNENSRIGVTEFIKYLQECFIADRKLQEMVYNKVADDILPITLIEFSEYSDLNEIKFSCVFKDKDREMSKREELVFKECCRLCFENIDGMYNRLFRVTNE